MKYMIIISSNYLTEIFYNKTKFAVTAAFSLYLDHKAINIIKTERQMVFKGNYRDE